MKGDGKLMDREEMRKELKSQMEELLRAAERLGFSFKFETISWSHVEYCLYDTIDISSDEEDFSIEVYDKQGW